MSFSARGGRFTGNGVPVRLLISWAYGVVRDDIRGRFPDWIESERFDVLATAERDAPLNEIRQMMQVLLEDRFKLKVREEPASVAAWALVRDRPSGELGPQMRITTGPCASVETPAEAAAAKCGLTGGIGGFSGEGATVSSMLSLLSANLLTPVVDETGLTGRFDVELRWDPRADKLVTDPFVELGLSLFTAIREQLGLSLRPTEAQGRALAIERIERPTEN